MAQRLLAEGIDMTQEIDKTVRAVGVVGLGAVGRVITARLLDLGLAVTVYDENPTRLAAAVGLGARAAELPADVAELVDVVVLAVRDDRLAEEMLFELGGIGETLRSGGLVLDASTTSAGFAASADARLARFGIRRVDVSTSVDEVIGSIAA
jgi:3-hydroxyisobutyrate dehydrogenase-like beta-hydroxyacid dehydrogenase